MIGKSKIKIFCGLILAVSLFCNCRQKNDDTNVLNQPSETVNQTIINVSRNGENAAEPAIAANKEKNIYVVYVEHNPDKSADVYLQKFDKGAKPDGERTRINPEQGQAKAWFGDPPTIKINADNVIYVGWTAKVESTEKPAATILYLSSSRDGGKSFAAPVKVNDDSAPASHGMHSLALGKDNQVYMVWLDERNINSQEHAENSSGDATNDLPKNDLSGEFRFIKAHHNSNQGSQIKPPQTPETKAAMNHENAEPNSEVFFAVSRDGGKSFSKNIKLSSEVCPCCKTNLAVDKNGKLYASWRQVVGDNYRHIAVASSENDGESFSAYKIVSDDKWQIIACPVSGAPIKFDEKNDVVIAWYTAGKAGDAGIYSARINTDSENFSPRTLVSGNASSGTPVFGSDKNSKDVLIYEADGKIFKTELESPQNTEFVANGSSPAASFENDKIYLAYVKKESDKRIVQLKIY